MLYFGMKGKLAPGYIGPFEVIERIGPVAYKFVWALCHHTWPRYIMCSMYPCYVKQKLTSLGCYYRSLWKLKRIYL